MGAGGTVAVFRFPAEATGRASLILDLRHGNEPDEGAEVPAPIGNQGGTGIAARRKAICKARLPRQALGG